MAQKLFINNTKRKLEIQLLVRKGDEIGFDADPVSFTLGDGSGNAEDGGSDHTKLVRYGNKVDIFLNGMVVRFMHDGNKTMKRFQVLERGVPLDDKLNRHNTVEFVFDTMLEIKYTNTFDLANDPSVASFD